MAKLTDEQYIDKLHDKIDTLTNNNNALWKECAEYKAEIADLWAFVRATDAHEQFRTTVPEHGMELWIARWETLKRDAGNARITLDKWVI